MDEGSDPARCYARSFNSIDLMPLDLCFTSNWKGKSFARIEFDESIEKQIGRSDCRLGELRCPWPPGSDAKQWQAGFDQERASWPQPPEPKKRRKSY
jgi:hypothetical protein